ncbi:MAG: aldehyde ferredoxin oxidoreductase family protein [Parcubacteria group bacterium]|nr:aldehyde ferredoxin oxidoreductase family protein [Parcubacteria group bacterium]
MYSVAGKMLTINLKIKSSEIEEIPKDFYSEYLGGYGLGVALLMERMDPTVNALGPKNILGFATGYLTGTGAYIASRFMVFGKSPSTEGWGDSNCGGYFGKKMKQAGFDVILFKEISSEPVYLFVDHGYPQLLKADWLWGKDCYETDDLLKEKHGKDCEIACIGLAGEKLSFIAGISTDKGRFAARSALGAVMGSKKIKAVVLKGNNPIILNDSEKMKKLRKKYLPVFKEGWGKDLSLYGTSSSYKIALYAGDAPIKNWSSSVEEMKNSESVDAEGLVKYQIKRYGCSGCPICCGGYVEVKKGPFKTETPVHKVEYETMGMFGSNLLNENIESLIKINDLCNRYGMDTIGCGSLCGFAIECFEKGLITKEDTDGIELNWGDPYSIIFLVEKIGKAEGIGEILSKGFKKAIEIIGGDSEKYAMVIRNEAFPAHDPRWSGGLALTYYSDPTPARHTQGSVTFPVGGYEIPKFSNTESSGWSRYHKDIILLTQVLNSAGLCLFGYGILDYKTLPEFLNAADGRNWSVDELKKIGLRIYLLRHIFNLRAGVNFRNFSFPKRVLGEPPLNSGATKGVCIDLNTMVDEYQKEMQFDPKTMFPKRDILEKLNIDRYLS